MQYQHPLKSLPLLAAVLQAISEAPFDIVCVLFCLVDPAYLTAHPEEAAAFSSPPARAPLPYNQSDVGARRRLSSVVPPARRHLSQALNGTQLYWEQFGQTDAQRFHNLATALSRAMYTWVIDTCLAKYPMTPPKTGPRMLGFFCAYFGGPATLEGCSYQDPASGQNLTSADIDGLHVSWSHAHAFKPEAPILNSDRVNEETTSKML